MSHQPWTLIVPALLSAALLAACTPNYVVMNASPTAATSSNQASSYPDLSTAPKQAQKTGNVAVIVAIEEYAFLPAVPGAVDNAVAWENYLRNARGFSDVFVLTNKQAPIEEIQRFAAQAANAATADGELWFVFIGHGAALKDGSDGALIGMDAQQTVESIGARSVAQNDILSVLHKGAQARTVVVLDTCFSGRDGEGELLAVGTQPVLAIGPSSNPQDGTVVLSAAGSDEIAGQLPGASKPAFSYLLLGALRGWADDGDGSVTAQEAIQWTQQQMRHVPGRQQTPSLSGDGGLVLATSLGEADPGIANLFKAGGNVKVSSSTTIEGGTQIDTQKGVIFVKPDDWGIGPAGLGIVVYLGHQYSDAVITVQRIKMSQANAGALLGAPKPKFEGDDITITRGPERVEYGAATGTESEFHKRWAKSYVVRFATYQHGAAWVIDLTLPHEAAEADTFQAFLESEAAKADTYPALQAFLESLTFY